MLPFLVHQADRTKRNPLKVFQLTFYQQLDQPLTSLIYWPEEYTRLNKPKKKDLLKNNFPLLQLKS